MSRSAELEARLIENPSDDEARMVYADYLQSAGDPRGELIVMQDQEQLEEVDAYLDKHAERLLGPLVRYKTLFDGSQEAAFFWHLGFIRDAKLGYDSNRAGDVGVADGPEIALETGLAALIKHPSGMLLDDLTVTINMLDDGSYFDPIEGDRRAWNSDAAVVAARRIRVRRRSRRERRLRVRDVVDPCSATRVRCGPSCRVSSSSCCRSGSADPRRTAPPT